MGAFKERNSFSRHGKGVRAETRAEDPGNRNAGRDRKNTGSSGTGAFPWRCPCDLLRGRWRVPVGVLERNVVLIVNIQHRAVWIEAVQGGLQRIQRADQETGAMPDTVGGMVGTLEVY